MNFQYSDHPLESSYTLLSSGPINLMTSDLVNCMVCTGPHTLLTPWVSFLKLSPAVVLESFMVSMTMKLPSLPLLLEGAGVEVTIPVTQHNRLNAHTLASQVVYKCTPTIYIFNVFYMYCVMYEH